MGKKRRSLSRIGLGSGPMPMARRLSGRARMNSVSRPLPLRWVYPIIGAVVAAAGAGTLYAVNAQPLLIGVLATIVCVGIGWLLGQKWDTLRESAITDPLTGVANRRHFDQRLARSISQATRTGMPLTLLFVDVDHLKALNDKHGHSAGDAALKLVGEVLARTCRSRDIVARWGGDEFAILAMWTTSREGVILGQRIRETLARLARDSDEVRHPTVSIGVAELA
jgi:diguanylate cyclase (GGDEF)-like protein